MDIEEHKYSTYLVRQRNFFAGCMGLAVLSTCLLAGKLSTMQEKIVMVPTLSTEMIIDGNNVSASYLEESALLYASTLLDLTAETIPAKRNLILKNASTRSESSIKSLQEYFAKKEEEHKKFGLMTFFAAKKIDVEPRKLQVTIEGLLTSTFGKRGIEEERVKYLMAFDFVGGMLKLKEFKQIVIEVK